MPPKKILRQSEDSSTRDTDISRLRSLLENIEVVNNRLLRQTLMIIPWLMLIYALHDINLWIAIPGGVMWNSGYILGAICLLATLGMIKKIPTSFQALWDRQIVKIRSKVPSQVTHDISGKSIEASVLVNEYREFLENSQKSFNSPYQNFIGGFALLLSLIAIGIQYYWTYPKYNLGDVLERILIEGVPAFLLGILIWRMIIVGSQIWELSKQFDISPRLGHPDQCGGLEPIGNLCFWNALASSVAGIFFGGWIVVGTSSPSLGKLFESLGASYGMYYRYVGLAEDYVPLYSWLLLVTIVVSIMSFFWPVWRIHQIMLDKRTDIRRQLDQLSESIDSLTREMLLNADKLDPSESEKMAKKLERMRQVYNENKSIPVWPFNTRIVLKFSASQLVPVLSLTGLGEGIVRLLASLLTSAISN